MKRKSENQKFRFVVEIPKQLHERLQKEAVTERRSRNAQVIRLLEERYQQTIQQKQAA